MPQAPLMSGLRDPAVGKNPVCRKTVVTGTKSLYTVIKFRLGLEVCLLYIPTAVCKSLFCSVVGISLVRHLLKVIGSVRPAVVWQGFGSALCCDIVPLMFKA